MEQFRIEKWAGRIIFILLFIMSVSCHALIVKNEVSAQDGSPFLDENGAETLLKIRLTKVTFIEDKKNKIPEIVLGSENKAIKFGESIEINFADTFPNYKLTDDIYLIAFLDGTPLKTFLNPKITTQELKLVETDTIVVCAEACLSFENKGGGQFTQELYRLLYYVDGVEEESANDMEVFSDASDGPGDEEEKMGYR